MIARAGLVLATALAGGCTLYHAKPLTGGEATKVLTSPDRTDLAKRAAAFRHPLLAPVDLDFSRPLTADEVAVIVVLTNPDLVALRAQQSVARAQVFAAGLLPDPQLGGSRERVVSPRDQGYTTASAENVSVDVLGALATRSLARAAASASADALRLDIAWHEWTTAGEARLLALRLPYQEHSLDLATGAESLTERALAAASDLAASGDLKADEVEARRLSAMDARARRLSAERELEATRLDLNRLLGLAPGEKLVLASSPALAPWSTPDANELFAAARLQRLDLKALELGYQGQEATYHREILGQYPRLTIGINRTTDTSSVLTLGPAISLDLPLWNRNRGPIEVARAERERLAAEYSARLFQTRADIAALVTVLDRDERNRAVLRERVPRLVAIADATDAAAESGDVTRAVADTARLAATERELELIGAEQSCAEQRLALKLAVGAPFLGNGE